MLCILNKRKDKKKRKEHMGLVLEHTPVFSIREKNMAMSSARNNKKKTGRKMLCRHFDVTKSTKI